MEPNWTLEDFYAGRVIAYNDCNGKGIERLLKWRPTETFKYYSANATWNELEYNSCPPLSNLSYFISLLDAQEAAQKAAKEPEYIYEPFSEEAAKGGAAVMYGNREVEYIASRGDYVCVWYCDKMHVAISTTFTIRRTVETKEVECYVYASGYIASTDQIYGHGKIIETFTHTIKIPKK